MSKSEEAMHGITFKDKIGYARRAFCALQALTVKGNENHYWIQTLKSL